MFLISDEYYQIKTTNKKGRGVFARREISAGTIIGDYLGLVIKDEEIDGKEKKHGNSCYAMDYNDNGLSIFPADVKAVGIHLINHSCSPNCDAYFYYGHTLYFALRRIWPGEEITVDYGFDAEGSQDKELLHPCFCGSPFCRGTMYTNEARLKLYGRFCRQETKGQKFKALSAGQILPPLSKYPRVIKDNNIFNLFANLEKKSVSYNDSRMPSLSELRKRLRSSGRPLSFKRLGVSILAIIDGRFVAGK